MNINTGNGNDIVTRPAFVNGAVYREADVIRTNGGDDVINPGLGWVDRVYGGTGFDHLILDYSVDDRWGGINFNMNSNGLGSSRRNRITANSGSVDSIQFRDIEKLTITGTRKDDSIFTAGGSHTIFAGAGNDTVRAMAGYLDGGTGFDRLIINLSNQTSNLTLSNLSNIRITDVVTAVNFESFEITTGRGNDVVTQSAFINGFLQRANDVINTGAGNDVINAGLGQNDFVNGGQGLDHLIVDFSVGDTGTGMQFSTNLGVARASRLVSPGSRTQLDNLTSFNIERFTVTGTSKNDNIQSANGNDILFGGAGNDVLSGRGGADILNGGAGVDTFRFGSRSDSLLGSHDVIQDLNIGTDIIDGPISMGAAGVVASLVRKLGNVVSLTEAAIQRVLTPTTFVSNGASTFTFGNRTFVALNDAMTGFSAQTDSLIEITGYRGNLWDLNIK